MAVMIPCNFHIMFNLLPWYAASKYFSSRKYPSYAMKCRNCSVLTALLNTVLAILAETIFNKKIRMYSKVSKSLSSIPKIWSMINFCSTCQLNLLLHYLGFFCMFSTSDWFIVIWSPTFFNPFCLPLACTSHPCTAGIGHMTLILYGAVCCIVEISMWWWLTWWGTGVDKVGGEDRG